MNQKKQTAESKVKEIRRHTRKKYSAEEKNPTLFLLVNRGSGRLRLLKVWQVLLRRAKHPISWLGNVYLLLIWLPLSQERNTEGSSNRD